MRRIRLVAAAAPLILALAACSSAATPAPVASNPPVASQPPASQAPASAAPTSSGGTAEDEYEIKVAAGSGSVTNYLTGEDGKTLYLFAKDTADSGKSACGAGPCLDNWPPFTVDSLDEVKADSGVTGKVDVITRDDGTKQVTFKGLPLFYFAGDTPAGDTNGSAIPNWGVAHP
jgi:predicted lipoprotein with Yx(FWY)xxD motif